ncbi:hypothetical protein ACJQWK_09606 [Exserohilum turcicum]|uniref:Uncharacterized protein n=1 Tax=Exserohilum turcicum (strain 28A) TaxID=671987 RepID=R0JHA8_EXST2|nr:uncharacterized protein SETTUDRAFT_24289 [Exserohilum turcica Et28A]EOA80773.1 hypothetical protein SETTUDRAFT_24289 [Exserohilum turcica Et28A]
MEFFGCSLRWARKCNVGKAVGLLGGGEGGNVVTGTTTTVVQALSEAEAEDVVDGDAAVEQAQLGILLEQLSFSILDSKVDFGNAAELEYSGWCTEGDTAESRAVEVESRSTELDRLDVLSELDAGIIEAPTRNMEALDETELHAVFAGGYAVLLFLGLDDALGTVIAGDAVPT